MYVGGSGLSVMTQVRFMVLPSFRWMSGPPRISVCGSATTRFTTCDVGGVVEIWHSYLPASRCRTGLIYGKISYRSDAFSPYVIYRYASKYVGWVA